MDTIETVSLKSAVRCMFLHFRDCFTKLKVYLIKFSKVMYANYLRTVR